MRETIKEIHERVNARLAEDAREKQSVIDADLNRSYEDYAAHREQEKQMFRDCNSAQERHQQQLADERKHLTRMTAIDAAMAEFNDVATARRSDVQVLFIDAQYRYHEMLTSIIEAEKPDLNISVQLRCLAAALGKTEDVVCLDLEDVLAEKLESEQPEGGVHVNYREQLKARRQRARQEADDREYRRSKAAYIDDVPDSAYRDAVSPQAPAGPPVQRLDRPISLGTLDGKEVTVAVGKLAVSSPARLRDSPIPVE